MMINPFGIIKRWIVDQLRPNSMVYDTWRLRAQNVISFSFAVRRVIWSITFLAWQFVCLPRYLWQLILLAAEYDRLHFSPLRKIDKGYGCDVDHTTWLVNGTNVKLGDFVKISTFSCVMAGYKSRITIGSCTIVGPGVLIASFNHGFREQGLPIRFQAWDDRDENSIEIGENVWIGGHSIVLPGSRIGNGAVIAAGSIVRGVIEANVVFRNERSSRSAVIFPLDSE